MTDPRSPVLTLLSLEITLRTENRANAPTVRSVRVSRSCGRAFE